jgi:ADP-heptose:LPS heptosyltransferase
MGDVLMTSPAIRALKECFESKITLLTSSMAGGIAKYIPGIDEVIVSDVPWVKSKSNEGPPGFYALAETLRKKKFDAAVIFTVFSQNPMPAVMLAYLAGIPDRLAYCRENPYELLTVWVPDKEPYSFINHQVLRDIQLVAHVGATITNDDLTLNVPNSSYHAMQQKLLNENIPLTGKWIIVHPGASEVKREYPIPAFKNILEKIIRDLDVHVIFTGTASEKNLIEKLRSGIEDHSVSAAGLLSIDEFTALIDIAPVVLSVNTGTVHIAAAVKTPVVVLYAMTNPQHTPWKVRSHVFPYPVDKNLESKNEVLRYMKEHMTDEYNQPSPEEVVMAIRKLMQTVNQQPSLQDQSAVI